MKILVTGSSGTVGTRLCEKLLERGEEVIGVDWKPNRWKEDLNKLTINTDLRDEDAFEKLPSSVDAVMHLAANARVYELVKDPTMARDNFLTTFNVLEYARRSKAKRFIFTSSRETYGNIDEETLSEEMAQIDNCESAYTASKIGGEALIKAYWRSYGFDGVILRLSNVYGMYDNSDRVVPLFIRQAKANETMTVFGKEKCLDFTYIDDTISGLMLSLEKFDEVKNKTLNVAYGEGVTITHLAETIKKLLKSDSDIKIENNRQGEVVRYRADITKAKELLGYDPQVSFEEGIRKTVEWYEVNDS